MIILPLGPENASVRRWPVATYLIMAVCIAALIWTTIEMNRGSGDVERSFQLAVDYLGEHPHVDPDPQILREFSPTGSLEEARANMGEARMLEPKPSPEVLEEQQQAFEDLMQQYRDRTARLPLWEFGLVPANLEAADLLTHQLLHAGFLHLLGNLFFLYLIGPYLEDAWGRPLYLLIYLSGGVLAGLFFAYQYPTSDIPLVGASGAIAAMMGAFAVRFWRTKLRFFYFVFFIMGTFKVRAWLVLSLWGGRELLRAYLADSFGLAGGGGVAYWAHTWGFVFGAGIALLMTYLGVERKLTEGRVGRELKVDRIVARAQIAKEQGKDDKAWQVLAQEIERRPGNIAACEALWNLAIELDRQREATDACQRVIAWELAEGDRERGLELWYEWADWTRDEDREIDLELAAAEAMLASARENHARECFLRVMRRLGRNPSAERIVRIVRLATRIDRKSVPGLVRSALASDLLSEDQREELTMHANTHALGSGF